MHTQIFLHFVHTYIFYFRKQKGCVYIFAAYTDTYKEKTTVQRVITSNRMNSEVKGNYSLNEANSPTQKIYI